MPYHNYQTKKYGINSSVTSTAFSCRALRTLVKPCVIIGAGPKLCLCLPHPIDWMVRKSWLTFEM